MEDLNNILSSFAAVSLADMQRVHLQDRVELKYLLPVHKLNDYIGQLYSGHLILSIDNHRQFAYTTQYYDTPGFSFYMDHHNGRTNRIKVRRRLYEHTNDCYFEIKRKVHGIRTEKTRIPAPALDGALDTSELSIIPRLHTATVDGVPKIINTFNRMTLCDNQFTERITIDTNIKVSFEERSHTMQGVALVEVKQANYNLQSDAVSSLRRLGAHGGPFSKYALGVAYLYPNIKHNNFKPLLLQLDKYANGNN